MSFLSGLEAFVRASEPLAMHTWFQLGGPAEYFAEPRNVDELVAVIRRAREEDLAVHLLGRGTNLLIRDEGVPGVVITLSDPTFRKVEVAGNAITAGAGVRLGRVVTTAVHGGLAGLEGLVAIPGTFGGAVFGNAGAHGDDIGQWVAQVTVLTDGCEILQRDRDELVFDYRYSSLDDPVILAGRLELEEEDPRELSRRMQKHWIVRKARQPMGHESSGCIFRNPPGLHAGELIDRAGLKGTRIGGAVVSMRHANFIIAEPECTSQDVLRLIDLIRTQVEQRLEVELEQEIDVW
ncbi:MAG TPA: UDP-N-acetylenolpyruvoylglucosamine reductase [Planctomycetaceae bacterium]|nr:UDP-N-acetylenolpyruvoylglucosamine reductase [Planctomycetaceae bacterium]